MSAPISARTNTLASAGAVNMMPGGVPRSGTPRNPLLVRDAVGKAKPSCYDLPDNRFAYGRPGNHDQEGAREVSMFWVSHKPSPTPECAAPDFVWFNKRAASARVTTARDLAFYRKENDNLTPRYGFGPGKSSTPRGNPSTSGFAYGKKVRPSTPIDEVISHRFAEQAEEELNKFYTEFRDQQENASCQVRKINMTHAARAQLALAKKAHQQEETREDRQNFKINKFKHIYSKVDDGRESARRKSGNNLLSQFVKEKERCASQASDRPAERYDGEEPLPGAYDTL